MHTVITCMTGLVLMMGVVPLAWAQTTPSVTGTVQQYLLSPHGEVDGLLLSDGTVVKFPPHLGIALAASVKPGDPVTVIGFLGITTPHGRAIKALTITNTTTGQALVDQPPASRKPPEPDTTRNSLTVSGTVVRYLVNPHGDVDGFLLSGGEQVKFPPHQGSHVQDQLARAEGAISVTGSGMQNAFGTVVKAHSLVVNGRTVSLDDQEEKHEKKRKHEKGSGSR